jgi:hypothetical protein
MLRGWGKMGRGEAKRGIGGWGLVVRDLEGIRGANDYEDGVEGMRGG